MRGERVEGKVRGREKARARGSSARARFHARAQDRDAGPTRCEAELLAGAWAALPGPGRGGMKPGGPGGGGGGGGGPYRQPQGL